MRLPEPVYPLLAELEAHLPELRPAQQRTLALWCFAAIAIHCSCESRVVAFLSRFFRPETIRQRLRELLRSGPEKCAPCGVSLSVLACFPALLRWLLSLWQGDSLVLALDATDHGAGYTTLLLSAVYRSRALPLAWQCVARAPGAGYLPPILRLINTLAPVMPSQLRVLVLADRGLWSPRLYEAIRAAGWHPLLRVQHDVHLALPDGRSLPASALTPTLGQAWVGEALVHKQRARQLRLTVLVVWTAGHRQPWVLYTDLAPRAVGPLWYGLRCWIECGFRDCKHYGWDWDHTRRLDLERVERYLLVLAVASLWVLAAGTAVEDAGHAHTSPPPPRTGTRRLSIFQQGLMALIGALLSHIPWQLGPLVPEQLPDTPPDLLVTYGAATLVTEAPDA